MDRAPMLARCATAMLALALAGCGSSTTVVTDSTAGSTSQGATAPTAAVTSTGTGSAGATSRATTSMSAPHCTAARLSLSVLGQQGATGHGEIGFALRNSGAGACHTFGFPGVLFLSGTGQPLPTDARRVTHDFFGSAPAAGLVLSPGQSASFRLGVTHGQATGAGCVTAAAVQVIPPDDTHALRVTVPNGLYECGTATVSPLRPGNSAFG